MLEEKGLIMQMLLATSFIMRAVLKCGPANCVAYNFNKLVHKIIFFRIFLIKMFHFLTVNFGPENESIHHADMSVQCIPPYIPLLYSETGVYRGIHFFLIFAL